MLNSLIFKLSILALTCVALTSHAESHPDSVDKNKYKMGGQIYSVKCAVCHGENADGRGKMIPYYIKIKAARPSNFKVKIYTIRPTQYLAKIIRDGGKKHSLSEYMPPFESELNSDQINDVVYFIQNVSVYENEKEDSKISVENKVNH